MKLLSNYTISSLGDSAILIDFGNIISEEINKQVISLCNALHENPFLGFVEAVPAYSSLAIYYDPLLIRRNTSINETVFENTRSLVEIMISHGGIVNSKPKKVIRIPVCYDPSLGFDLNKLEEMISLPKEQIIDIHTSKNYRVYMIGFLPGFPYMGEVDATIAVPRKENPVAVPAGSVGLAGRQTGIYPMNSPGGWQIIGRTPLKLFLPAQSPPVLLKAGDEVQFFSITYNEFTNY